jgi:hypothetical protein
LLPKLSHPTNSYVLPGSNKKVSFRPMLALEEKLLLMVKEGGSNSDEILSTVASVCQNCMLSGDDVLKLPVFDLEKLFIQLRKVSVSPIAEVSYIDREDGKQYDFQIDLDTVQLTEMAPPPALKLQDDIVLQLKWPTVGDYIKATADDASAEQVSSALELASLDKVFVGDSITDAAAEPDEEKRSFIDQMPLEKYHELLKFLDGVPHLRHELNYKNSKGNDRRIVLTKLADFFAFR